MLEIPRFMSKDNYLQNPIMRRFLDERKRQLVDIRSDYLEAIQTYANENKNNEEDTRKWLLQVVREGSKDFCYKRVYGIQEILKNPDVLKRKLRQLYPDCPMQDVLTYKHTYERNLINYEVKLNEQGEADIISFTFSQIFLVGNNGSFGESTVFPLFIDVYLNNGYIMSRAKAKTTIYNYTEDELLLSDSHVDSLNYANDVMEEIISAFEWKTETDARSIKNNNARILHNMYKEFSFTPQEVVEKVNSVKSISDTYIDNIFNELGLNSRNKEMARIDLSIFVEKYISINGNNENIFKKDRPAFLTKVKANDEQDLTSIDTATTNIKPLQCTEAFFDSKKSVIKSGKCNKIHLCFKRTNPKYFGKIPISVQFCTKKTYGVFKISQYAEEADINNVIQTIFRNS